MGGPFGGAVRGDGADGFEALVTGVAFCEIDGWCRCCVWGLVTARCFFCFVFFCEIDGKLRSKHVGDSCAGDTICLRCCLGCWLWCFSGCAVRGAGVQSLARVLLFGVYAGVLFHLGLKQGRSLWQPVVTHLAVIRNHGSPSTPPKA